MLLDAGSTVPAKTKGLITFDTGLSHLKKSQTTTLSPSQSQQQEPSVLDRNKQALAKIQKRRPRRLVNDPNNSIDFYDNIWDKPNRDNSSALPARKSLVDISQVAFVVTRTVDYKSDYLYLPPQRENNQEPMEAQDPTANSSTCQEQDQEQLNIWEMDFAMTSSNSSGSIVESSSRSKAQLKSQLSKLDQDHDENSDCGAYVTAHNMQNSFMNGPAIPAMAVPPPSSNFNGKVIFSNVFTRESHFQWNVKFVLTLHEPLRHALYVVDRFFDQQRQHQPTRMMEWTLTTFFNWFKSYFVEFVKCQHEIKRNYCWPRINLKRRVRLELMKIYSEVLFFLDAISFQEASFVALTHTTNPVKWLERLQVLQSDVRKLSGKLQNALTLEEKTICPGLLHAFSEKSFQQYIMPVMVRSIRPKKVIMPWIIERIKIWGGHDEAMLFKQEQLGFSSRVLYDRIWLPYFLTHVAGTMRTLDYRVERPGNFESLPKDDWFACTIQ